MSIQLDNLAEAIGGAPDLKGARCKGSTLWDITDDPAIVEYTTTKCLTSCAARALCESYADEIGHRKLSGVWAGKVYAQPKPREKNTQ